MNIDDIKKLEEARAKVNLGPWEHIPREQAIHCTEGIIAHFGFGMWYGQDMEDAVASTCELHNAAPALPGAQA